MRSSWGQLSQFISLTVARSSRRTIEDRPGTIPPADLRRVDVLRRWYSADTATEGAPSTEVKLRPYQEESINAVLSYLARGERRLGLSLATGSGKTVIFSHLIDRVKPPKGNATQTLVLAHRRELVQQAATHCRKLYPDKTIDLEMGNQHATGHADITVASVRSLLSGERLLKYNPDSFKLVLVDEAHHIVAPQYMDVLRHFRLVGHESKPDTALVGVSATFSRFDGLKLGAAIDYIVYHKDYLDMIEDEWLSKVIFTTVKSAADLSKVAVRSGDFQTNALSKAVNTEAGNLIAVRTWLDRASARMSTLVFCVDIAHLTALATTFRQHGIDARSVTGETPHKIRAETLTAFKNAEFPVLLNCGIFTEGTDIPNIDCILLARPTKSRNLLIQMLGRGLRKHTGKTDCHVIDIVSSLETGIITTPTLFGLDPDELIEHASAADLQTLQQQRKQELEREGRSPISSASSKLHGPLEFTDYDTVQDLLSDTSGDQHIRALSRNAWVCIDPTRFILPPGTGGDYLTIQGSDKDDGYTVFHVRKLPAAMGSPSKKSPFARRRAIAEKVGSLVDAVHAADSFVAANRKAWPLELMLWQMGWRRRPATDAQMAFLNKNRDADDLLTSADVTKGQAIDWITKLKHGARSQFKQLAVRRRKALGIEEKKQKFDEMQRLSQVKVGALEP